MTILVGLLLGMFLAALDQTVVATAIRTIADDLDGFSLQAWATTAFLITSTIATPLYGKLSDIYGRKPFFLFAISIFIVGSMLCGLAGSMYQLAAYRAIQGIGAGGLFSLALAIIGDIVPPRERARYQGYFLAVFGTSSVLGPVIGGFFAGQDSIIGITGWRWIFYVNVPIGILALVVVTRVLHLPHRRTEHRIDWWGATALVVALIPLLTVAEQGRDWGWGSGLALTCYAVGAIGIVAFLLAERTCGDDALLPLRLFRLRTFAVGAASSLIVGMGMFGVISLLPLYLQIVKGSSPTLAGLQIIPLVAGIMAGAIGSGQFIARTGRYKVFPVVGTALMIMAAVLLHVIGADTPLWQTMIYMVPFGLGLGFNMQPIILAVQNAVSPREIGVATSSVTFFRQMGGTLGVAVFLSVLFTTVSSNIGSALAQARTSPEFLQALRANPDQAQLLQSSREANASLQDTSFISALDPRIAHPFQVGFSDSMDSVFLLAAVALAVGFVVVLFLPELPLRTQSALQARAAEGAPPPGGAAAGAPPVQQAAADGGTSDPASQDGMSPDGMSPDGMSPDGVAGRHARGAAREGDDVSGAAAAGRHARHR